MIAAIDASSPIGHITAYHITVLKPLGGAVGKYDANALQCHLNKNVVLFLLQSER
jgi:hypothetical protein